VSILTGAATISKGRHGITARRQDSSRRRHYMNTPALYARMSAVGGIPVGDATSTVALSKNVDPISGHCQTRSGHYLDLNGACGIMKQ
jgi:hypothetical protein